MIVPPAVERRHTLVEGYVREVGERVRDIMSGFCEREGYAFLGRLKSVSSVAEKLESGRFRKWGEIDDLYACAVIIPTLGEEARVLEFLSEQFSLRELRARASTHKDPDVFRFDATRFIGTIRDDALSYGPIASIKFEVQIRSAFEHAWSVSTHALAYKGGNVGWRYKRIAAQLRASIEQLDQLVLGFQQWSDLIREQAWHSVDDQRALVDKFSAWVKEAKIPVETAPQSWARFAENLYSFITSVMKKEEGEYNHSKNIPKVLSAIENELSNVSGELFPRSVSLLQFCIGAMCKAGLVDRQGGKYCTLVTDELKTFYPEVSRANLLVFDFEF